MNVTFALVIIITYKSSHGGTMKVSKEKMDENRTLILSAAARLFRERGFRDVTVADVMSAVGLTHGAFPSHFKSKEDLFAQALELAAGSMSAESASSIREYAAGYLVKEHREATPVGCVYAALAGEVARSTPDARHAMTVGLKKHLETLAEKAPGRSPEARRQEAVTAWATMVGALLLSRVVDDEALADEILERTRLDLAR
jgi:TetR/AcrR family transcriptional repressor of nem operon